MQTNILKLVPESNSSFAWNIQESLADFEAQCKSESVSKVVLIGCNSSGTMFIYNMAQCSDLEASGMAMNFIHRKTE